MSHPGQPSAFRRLLPVLVRIQAQLDEALPLAALAAVAGLSPAQFHRRFREVTGETPVRYGRRLRLERAAFRLLVERTRIVDIAIGCGFRSHETFSRAFRRRFGVSPRDYRAARSGQGADHDLRPPERRDEPADCAISATHVRELEDLPVAFIRHVGPYDQVGEQAWDRLIALAVGRCWPGPRLLLGIAHDAPGITPDHQLRFDAALRAPATFRTAGEIGFQTVPGGLYAVTTHVGPFATLEHAYRRGFERMAGQRRYRMLGLPAVEIYHATRINPAYALNHTDVCLPLALR